MKNLPTSGIRKVFDQAQLLESRGREVLHLEIGRPDWPAPACLREQTIRAVDNGFIHYIANRGVPELRAAIAEDIRRRTGTSYDPDTELIVTTGASEGLAMCALAFLEPGDEMIVPEPAWPHYKATAAMGNAKAVTVPLDHAMGFELDPCRVEDAMTARTKIIVINNPNNPTGAVYSRESLKAVIALAEKHGCFILADEVYQDFVFQGRPFHSLATLCNGSDRLILLNSLSKSYAMTGYRIGYIAAAPAISDTLNRVHQYLTVCGTAFAQKGAAALFADPSRDRYLADMKAAFEKRLMPWVQTFRENLNFQFSPPSGAFYIFPKVNFNGMTATEFCHHALHEAHVAMVPGTVFGDEFSQYVRISYGLDIPVQEKAAHQLLQLLGSRE